MPTYSYKCTECGNAFDIQQAFTDDALTECPNCGGRLRKVFGSIGVTFNGSGFYRTDSRAGAAGGTTGGGSGDSGSKSESGSKSDSGSGSESGAKKSEFGAKSSKKETSAAPSSSSGSSSAGSSSTAA